jgi:ABC-type Fe3+/spermidine/putrescine transport system ATPase subunit
VVLMDEPLGALDKNLRFEMQVEIKEIQRRIGMTIVYVTHDQEEAMNMSDRIAIMNNGRIEQVGRPGEIYDNPETSFIARFLGEANLVAGTVEVVGRDGAVLRTAAGARYRARAGAAIRPGEAGNLFVRPERVRFAEPGDAAGDGADCNVATGQLRQTSFLGHVFRHAVEIEPGVRMTVDVHNASAGLARAADRPATLTWRVADGVVLPR